MERIFIENQEQFDNLPASFEQLTEIFIIGRINQIIGNHVNSIYIIGGNAKVEWIGGNAKVEWIGDSANVEWIGDSANVKRIGDNAKVKRIGRNAKVEWIGGNAKVERIGRNAKVERIGDSANVELIGDSANVKLIGRNAKVKRIGGNAKVKRIGGNAKVERIGDNANVAVITQMAIVIVFSKNVSINQAELNAIVIFRCEPFDFPHDDTVTIVHQKNIVYDIAKFLMVYPENALDDDYVLFYKSVNPETNCDFFTGTIKYEVDKWIECPDFDSNPDRECGGGLHLSPLPEIALTFNQGKLLKCKAHKSDVVVYPNNIDKVRCKKVFVIGEV